MSPHYKVPRHIAIIMDGNGRWANQLGKSRSYGHRAGHTAVLKTVRHAAKLGVKSLTLYAFSSENWSRPQGEIDALMVLFSQAIKRNKKQFQRHQLRFCVIGDKTALPTKLQRDIAQFESETADNSGLIVNIAANYGSKWDIVNATKQLAKQVENGELMPEDITEARLSEKLCLAGQDAVDLLIRTGGECRMSNYLLWQCAYAELYFTSLFWPQFDEQALETAIADYQQRTRRFGGVIPPSN